MVRKLYIETITDDIDQNGWAEIGRRNGIENQS